LDSPLRAKWSKEIPVLLKVINIEEIDLWNRDEHLLMRSKKIMKRRRSAFHSAANNKVW